MAKQVTRTITRYKYTLIKTEQVNGAVQIADAVEVIFDSKIGSKKLMQWVKDGHEQYKDYVIGGMTEVNETYAMDLSKFLEGAVKVEKEDN